MANPKPVFCRRCHFRVLPPEQWGPHVCFAHWTSETKKKMLQFVGTILLSNFHLYRIEPSQAMHVLMAGMIFTFGRGVQPKQVARAWAAYRDLITETVGIAATKEDGLDLFSAVADIHDRGRAKPRVRARTRRRRS